MAKKVVHRGASDVGGTSTLGCGFKTEGVNGHVTFADRPI